MLAKFAPDGSRVLVIHENGNEYAWLTKFPALTRHEISFALPLIPTVVYNVLHRIADSTKNLKIDKSVYEWMNQDFKLLELPEGFIFHTEPLLFQRIALRYIYTMGSAGLLLDPGMGKSKVVLDYIHLKRFSKVIVVCPKPLVFVWEDEIKKHRPELSYYSVQSTDFEAERVGIESATVTIINYNKAVDMRHQLKKVGFEFIHLDEFLIKNPTTERTQGLTHLSQSIPFRCGGSGTLINNSVFDVFSPVRYLQPALVGGNYSNFLNRFGVFQPRDKSNPSGPKRIVAFTKTKEARSILESCCIVMSKAEWLKNLPEKVITDVYVQMGDVQRDVYYQLTRNYLAFMPTDTGKLVDVEVDNPLVMLSKLYQISNGFIYENPDPASNEVGELLPDAADAVKGKKPSKKARKTHFFKEQPKIEALRKLLTETLKGQRAIIWFNMSGELELIRKLLDELGETYTVIKGGETKTGEKVREYNNNPAISWLVCQAKSVNYGITVLGTTLEKLEEERGGEVFTDVSPEVFTEIFYSINFSLEVYLQQMDRIHRIGQKHTCQYYRIFVNNPIEKKLKGAIEDKMSIREEMLVDIAEKLKEETLE